MAEAKQMIPYGTQTISLDDANAVLHALTSPFITQGPRVPMFEDAVCSVVKARYGVAMNSATSALHAACVALDIGPGDLVWTSPISFVASANCARYCGADVDFVDIDPDTLNMCPIALSAKLEEAERKPKAIIVVHMSGFPAEMAIIKEVTKAHNIAIIEDASHALGATMRGYPVGSCEHSEITVFSFHPVKMITTGEGGMAVTNDPELAEKMELFRSHGIVRGFDEPWYYEQQSLGMNYRMTDIAAALGLSQLEKLDDFCGKRHDLAIRYWLNLKDIVGRQYAEPSCQQPSHHLHIIRVPAKKRGQIFKHMRANGIGVQVHYIPIYWHPYYEQLGFQPGLCPNAEDYYFEAMSLPIYPDLEYADQNYVIETLKKAL